MHSKFAFVTICIWLPFAASAQSLPQGLTCGLSYATKICPLIGSCSYSLAEDNACNGVHTITLNDNSFTCACTPASPGSSLAWCNPGAPTGQCVTSCIDGSGYCTATATPGPNAHAGPGYVAVFDGDVGEASGDGYTHQELTAGVTDATVSDTFALPEGTICGFHHTGNSPGRTCMGFNPSRDPAFSDITDDTTGQPGCPYGWMARRAFDMSSGSEYWTWCEYGDIHNLSPGNSMPYGGVVCGMSDNDTTNHAATTGGCMRYGTFSTASVSSCPTGTSNSEWLDDGESSNVGLGFCNLGTASFPQPNVCSAGLTWCQASSACHNLQSDSYNCGACGNACGVGSSCQNGGCVATTVVCKTGYKDCGDGRCVPNSYQCP